jgi:UPF0755 protein
MKRLGWRKLDAKTRTRLMVGTVIAVAILAIGTVLAVRQYYYDNLKPVSASQTTVTVVIPSGSSLEQVSDILQKAKVIRKAWAFKQYVLSRDKQNLIQAGTYAIKPSQSVRDIVDIITEGKVASNLVTIKPAQRIDQIEQALVNSGFAPADVKAALNPALYAGHPALVDKPAEASLEGYLYPESFQKTSETKPEQIIRASLDEMQKRLTPDVRAAFAERGLTVHRAITLASIVEREVPAGGERSQVAQVFFRRLAEDKRLESDATASYGAILAGQEPSLSYDSAYNTYTHDGLPPGPISNVSESSIQAVAHPADTDWLYFVSGDDGITYFSKTLEEHEALTAQHCKKLCR